MKAWAIEYRYFGRWKIHSVELNDKSAQGFVDSENLNIFGVKWRVREVTIK